MLVVRIKVFPPHRLTATPTHPPSPLLTFLDWEMHLYLHKLHRLVCDKTHFIYYCLQYTATISGLFFFYHSEVLYIETFYLFEEEYLKGDL